MYLRDSASMWSRRGLAVDGVDKVTANLGPIPRIVSRVNQDGDARVALEVLDALTLGFRVHKEVLTVGVDPSEQRLRLAIGHECHDRGEIRTSGEANDIGVQQHGDALSWCR